MYDSWKIDIYRNNNNVITLECVSKEQNSNEDTWWHLFQNKLNSKSQAKCCITSVCNVLGPLYWGRYFEEIATTKKIKEDKNREICCIIESILNNKHKLLMACEMDCLNKNNKFVEIKTTKYMTKKKNNTKNYGYNGYEKIIKHQKCCTYCR